MHDHIETLDKKYNTLKNIYEITFNSSSEIHEVMEEDSSIAPQSYNFVKIDQISTREVGENIYVYIL